MSKHKKLHPLLGSSANPEELAMTVKGLLVSLVPIALLVLTSLGLQVDESVLLSVVNEFTTALSAVLIAFGASRKFYYFIKSKFFTA